MSKQHHYELALQWTGNAGQGTKSYTGYSRNHEITVPGKPMLPCSSDPSFRGDASRYNPEELLLAAISNCHMLWFLHLCSEAKVVVTGYRDVPTAVMAEESDGAGQFTEAVLHPVVTLREGDASRIEGLHEKAHEMCFIARSVNFPVTCQGEIHFESANQ